MENHQRIQVTVQTWQRTSVNSHFLFTTPQLPASSSGVHTDLSHCFHDTGNSDLVMRWGNWWCSVGTGSDTHRRV